MSDAVWDRQDEETAAQFEAFTFYRDLGPRRSLKAVAARLKGSRHVSRIEEWSRAHRWVQRAAAYDLHLDHEKVAAAEKAFRDMGERHAGVAIAFQNKVVQRLAALDATTLSANELIRWFEVSVKIERLSRGETTQAARDDFSGAATLPGSARPAGANVDLTQLSDQELDDLEHLARRAARSAQHPR